MKNHLRALIVFAAFVSQASAQAPSWTRIYDKFGPTGSGATVVGPLPTDWFIPRNVAGQNVFLPNNYVTHNSIYGNSLWTWDTSTHTGSEISNNGGGTDCPADTGTWPGSRHFTNSLADSLRGSMVIVQGVCQGNTPTQMWSWKSATGWTVLTQNSSIVGYTSGVSVVDLSNFVHDSDVDVYIVFGFDSVDTKRTQIYCPTDRNPIPGTLTANQTTAGCATADGWTNITSSLTGGTQPGGAQFMSLGYDTTNHKVIGFAGTSDNAATGLKNEIWTYTTLTKTWALKHSGSGTAPVVNTCPSSSCIQAAVLVGSTLYYLDHQSPTHDWSWSYSTNTWTDLGANGGPANAVQEVYDPTTQTLILWVTVSGQAYQEVWEGHIGVASSQCWSSGAWPSGNFQWLQCDVLASVTAGSTAALTLNGPGGLSVPVTAREALYSGVSGVARTSEPLHIGVPLADSAGITSTSGISVVGGSTVSSANLATDNGATITVATGAATITLKKANHNGFDVVDVGSTHVVLAGASQGPVLAGPVYPATTCGTCTTAYSSNNDSASTCSVTLNGPIRATVKCSGHLKDSSGNSYLGFTNYYDFSSGSASASITSQLWNSDYGATSTFATAYKGLQSYELRIGANLSGTLNYSVGNHTGTPTTGTFTTSNSIVLYQGKAITTISPDYVGSLGFIDWTTDTGYTIKKDTTTLQSGTQTQPAAGWADVSNSSGAGMLIGVDQLAGYYPKSLEFNSGTDVRIGIWARENSSPVYQAWPQYSTSRLLVTFHAAAISSPADEFTKFQSPLVSYASPSYYNSTGALEYPVLDGAAVDSYMTSLQTSGTPSLSSGSGCCVADIVPNTHRYYYWANGGGDNQAEFRLSNMLNLLTRGETGRWLDSVYFYRMQADVLFARTSERSYDWYANHASDLNSVGYPSQTSANNSLAMESWLLYQPGSTLEHLHTYGDQSFYKFTGEEWMKQALLDKKSYFLPVNTYQSGAIANSINTRVIGAELIGASRMSNWLASIGDSDAAGVSTQATQMYTNMVAPELCMSGYPSSCSVSFSQAGISYKRGAPWGPDGTSTSYCGVSGTTRTAHMFMTGIWTQGVNEFAGLKGPGWSGYWKARDLAYGAARWATTEMWVGAGSAWDVNGFAYGISFDSANCNPNSTEGSLYDFKANPTQPEETIWPLFSTLYGTDGGAPWSNKANLAIQANMGFAGMTSSDFAGYQIPALISIIQAPGSKSLQDRTITSFTDNGGGSYTIGWNTPASTDYLRVKYAPTGIVDWIGFDPIANSFTGDSTKTAWFAAINASSIPAPSTGSQSVTVATGTSGLTAANFAVKAMAPPQAPTGTTVYLRSSAPAAVQITSATTATPVVVQTNTGHGFASTCGTSITCYAVASMGLATNGTCPVNSTSVGSAEVVNYGGGSFTVKYIDSTHLELHDTSATPLGSSIAGHGTTWCSGESYFYVAGNQWIGQATTYTLGSQPLGLFDGPTGNTTRALALGTANGLTSAATTGCPSACVITVMTSFDPTAMPIPVVAGNKFSVTGTGTGATHGVLDACGVGGGQFSPYTIASVSSSGWVSSSFSCTSATNGTFTGLNLACGAAGTPNDTIGGSQDCVRLSLLAYTGNPMWDALITNSNTQSLRSSPGYKFVFDGGVNYPFSTGYIATLAPENAALLFMVDQSNPTLLAALVYYMDHLENFGGVNWNANEGVNTTNADWNGTNVNQFEMIAYLYGVGAPYRTAAALPVFRNKTLNDVDDPTVAACSTANAVVATPSPSGPVISSSHTTLLVSGTAQAGSSTSITLASGDTAGSGFYVHSVVVAANSYGLVAAYNNTTKVATVGSWSNGNPTTGTAYKIYAGASPSSVTAGATVTVTGVNTLFSAYNVGDGLQLSNGGFDADVGSNLCVIATISSNTSLTCVASNGVNHSVAAAGYGMVWYLPKWTTGDCGLKWLEKHDFGYVGSQPALYLPGGGNTSIVNGHPNRGPNNPVFPINHMVADFVLAADDARAVQDLSVVQGWLFDYHLSLYMNNGLGGLRSGAAYSWGTTGSLITNTLVGLYHSVPSFPNLDLQGGWLKNTAQYKIFNTYPDKFNDGSGQTTYAGLWGQTGGSAPLSFQNFVTQGYVLDPNFAFNPGTTDSKYLRNFLETTNPSSLWGANAVLSYQPLALFVNDPRIGSTSFTSLPHQVLIADNSAAACASITGLTCPSNIRGDLVISRTGLSSRSDSYLMLQGRAWLNNDHDTPSNGELSFYKVGQLLATDQFPADSDQQDNTITGNMLQIGGSANTPLGYPPSPGFSASPGVSPIVRWASANHGAFNTSYGDQNSQYAYGCVDLSGAYTVSVNYAMRCIFHSKPTSGDEFIFQPDIVSVPSATPIATHVHYPQNGEAPPASAYQEGTTTYPGSGGCGSLNTNRVVQELEDGSGPDNNPKRQFGLISRFLSPGTITVQCDGNSYSGANGHTERVSICAGSSCGSSQSSFTAVQVHKVAQAIADTTLTTAAINPDANWTGAQACGAVSCAVYLEALGGVTRTSLTSFTTTHGGTAQYLIGGLTAGAYAVTVGGTPVTGSPFIVASGDNSIEFPSGAGAVVLSQVFAPLAPSVISSGVAFSGVIK